jgi:DNA-binding transcriptional LysR family regulator
MFQASLDQIDAFVALAREGSIRAAAGELCLSEEGLRSRLLALEERLGVSLYEKERGRRKLVQLTPSGRAFFDKAARLIEEAQALGECVAPEAPSRKLKLLVSATIPGSLSAVVVHDFHVMFPDVLVHVCSCSEQHVLPSLRADTGATVGICELPDDPVRHPWFALGWCLLVSPGGPLAHRHSMTLGELAAEPLITFEPGTTAQQHVLEAFRRCGLVPRIAVTVTSFRLAVRMVEAGMGVAIVPAPPSGRLMPDTAVCQVAISDPIRPVEIHVVTQPASQKDFAVHAFMNFVSRSRLFGSMGGRETAPAAEPSAPAPSADDALPASGHVHV